MTTAPIHATPATLPILVETPAKNRSRMMMAYAVTGLFFMLAPGTFLGVVNLINISQHHGGAGAAWVQAHGHSQIFGWIGTFILGIGFYSVPASGNKRSSLLPAWTAWGLWTAGILLRWICGVYYWQWRWTLPLSAILEFAAFLIFFAVVSRHKSPDPTIGPKPDWFQVVIVSTFGFLAVLTLNLFAALQAASRGSNPAFPAYLDQRLLVLATWGFLVLTVWGFTARWVPTFLGLAAPRRNWLLRALWLAVAGVIAYMFGMRATSMILLAIASGAAVFSLRIFESSERAPKTMGAHPSFPTFVRIAYGWMLIAATLQLAALRADHSNGFWGASRHALTVGFLATMVFAIGQRVLPAFSGVKLLFSPKIMLLCLTLLSLGCTMRVVAQILAYESFSQTAWRVLPVSAVTEMTAVTLFALNLVLTFVSAQTMARHPIAAK